MRAWLSPAIFDWIANNDGGRNVDPEVWQIPFAHLMHGEKRLISGVKEDRIDAICAFKRSVDRRVRDMVSIYHLGKHPLRKKHKHPLELLAHYGLLRPHMLRRISNLRNEVEHHDGDPPSRAACLEFADLVWYFLKSTDHLVRMYPRGFLLTPLGPSYEGQDWIQFETGPISNWGVKLSGFVSGDFLSRNLRAPWIEIECGSIEGRDEVIDRVSREGGDLSRVHALKHALRPADSAAFAAALVQPLAFMDRITSKYFESASAP